jgi:C-terminal processing protease CtpA/Prc
MVVMREILQTTEGINETNFIKEGEKFSTVIQRNDKQSGNFGFSIAGGNQSNNGNENLYISKVNNSEQNSSLAIGDRLLSINGHDTGNISHDQALDIINNGGNNVELTIYREKYTNGNHSAVTTTSIDNTIEVCF